MMSLALLKNASAPLLQGFNNNLNYTSPTIILTSSTGRYSADTGDISHSTRGTILTLGEGGAAAAAEAEAAASDGWMLIMFPAPAPAPPLPSPPIY